MTRTNKPDVEIVRLKKCWPLGWLWSVQYADGSLGSYKTDLRGRGLWRTYPYKMLEKTKEFVLAGLGKEQARLKLEDYFTSKARE